MSVRDRVATYLQKYSRTRVLQILCGGCALALTACARNHSDDLLTTYSAQLSVDGNKPAIVTLHLEPGTYLIDAREQDIDLRMVVVGDSGEHAEVQDAVPRHGLHVQVASLKSAGDLRVELRSLDHRTKRGNATLRAARWRRAILRHPMNANWDSWLSVWQVAQTRGRSPASPWRKRPPCLNEAVAHFELARDDVAQGPRRSTRSATCNIF